MQQAALLTFVFTTATFAALILFAARDLHRVRPRALTALGLAFQPFGVALAPQALDGATYADNLIGSTVTLAGCVLLSTAMVLAANSNLITTTAEVRRSDAWWWGPMVITVAAVLTHSGLNRVPRGNPLVLNALAVCLFTVLAARIVLTVTRLQQANVDIKRDREAFLMRALTDPLTGLANRSALSEYLRAALWSASPAAPIAVLFCDLDRLKVVNDSLGHDLGDQLITAVARRWSSMVRSDSLLARVGGDEFVLISHVEENGHLDVAQRLHDALAEPFAIAGRSLTVHTSIGVSVATDPEVDPSDLLRDADAALYQAKGAGGRITMLFDERIRGDAVRRLELERHLRQAIREEALARGSSSARPSRLNGWDSG